MPTLHYQLLGKFQLTCDGEPVFSLNQGRLQSLLAYLALHRNAPQIREQLAALFWPQASIEMARVNLDQMYQDLIDALPAAEH
jgi:DNA-binding SARP family transcriptional activator